jgi:hypothetical protein
VYFLKPFKSAPFTSLASEEEEGKEQKEEEDLLEDFFDHFLFLCLEETTLFLLYLSAEERSKFEV